MRLHRLLRRDGVCDCRECRVGTWVHRASRVFVDSILAGSLLKSTNKIISPSCIRRGSRRIGPCALEALIASIITLCAGRTTRAIAGLTSRASCARVGCTKTAAAGPTRACCSLSCCSLSGRGFCGCFALSCYALRRGFALSCSSLCGLCGCGLCGCFALGRRGLCTHKCTHQNQEVAKETLKKERSKNGRRKI